MWDYVLQPEMCKFSDEKLKIVDFWKILKLLEKYEL